MELYRYLMFLDGTYDQVFFIIIILTFYQIGVTLYEKTSMLWVNTTPFLVLRKNIFLGSNL